MRLKSYSDIAGEILEYAEVRDFSGADPFDALNSPLLSVFGKLGKWPRIAAIQLLKRSSIELRPLLRVPPGVNPKALGLYLGGVVRSVHFRESMRQTVQSLLAALAESATSGYAGRAWGYHFPWQSRAFFLPRGTPTVVNTSIIANAVLDYAEMNDDSEWLDIGASSADFILTDLRRKKTSTGIGLSYSPIDNTAIYNATALGAALLARVGKLKSRRDCLDLANESSRFVMSRQRSDGSWPYAETDFQSWVDVFHTGFVIDALNQVEQHAPIAGIGEVLRKGREYFRDRFFGADGEVFYYDHPALEGDAHCYAQALITLCDECDPNEDDISLVRSVANRFHEKFVGPRGKVRHRSEWHWALAPHYMRWAQAWAFVAFAKCSDLLES